MDLKTAIQKVTDDYDFEDDQTRDPVVAVTRTRAEIDHQEVDFWQQDYALDADLASAYHTLLDTGDTQITEALAGITEVLA